MSKTQFMRGVADEFRRQFRAFPEALRSQAADIVERNADEAVQEMDGLYPDHTGNLRKQLRKKIDRTRFGVIAEVKNTAKHAHIFENGTQIRKTKAGANRGAMPPGNVFVPTMIRKRRQMNNELVALLEREGLEVTGG